MPTLPHDPSILMRNFPLKFEMGGGGDLHELNHFDPNLNLTLTSYSNPKPNPISSNTNLSSNLNLNLKPC